MSDELEIALYEMERHCNNFFNEKNDPDSPERNHPLAFIRLAERIAAHRARQDALWAGDPAVQAVSDAGSSVQFALDPRLHQPWQQAFARELGLYRRIRFL